MINEEEKIVVCSDVHIGVYTNFGKPVPNETLNDVSLDSIDAFQQVLDYCRDNNVTRLIVNGDLFDHRGTLDVRIINKVTKMLEDFIITSSNTTIYLLAGNHDQIDNSPKPENSLQFLESINDSGMNSTINVIDEPLFEPINDNISFYFIPYSEDVQSLKDWIADEVKGLDPRKVNFLFAHVGVEGATDGGLYTHRLGGAFAVGDLHYGDFTYVLLGHYHNRQELGTKHNMWYVGSTSQKSFSDEGQDKGFDIFDIGSKLEKQDFDFFTDYGDFVVLHKFIKTKGKKFVTIDMKTSKYTPEEIQQLMKDNYVRIITYNKEDTKTIQKVAKSENVNVAISLKEKQETKNRLGLKGDSSESQIVSTYAKAFYPDDPNVAKIALEQLEKAGQIDNG